MLATDILPGDEKWAYDHPLFSVSTVRNDGLHVHARVYWYSFNQYDDVSWHVNQDVGGMVRFKTMGNTPIILTDEVLPEYVPEPVSEVSRLKSWFTR